MNKIAFLLLVIIALFNSCECAEYEPSVCDSCKPPYVCNQGFCECDTNGYYSFAGYCEKKGLVTYKNMNLQGSCISDQVIIDSNFFNGLTYEYLLEYKKDSIFIEADKLLGPIFTHPDGDSLALRSAFEQKLINGKQCKPYYYGKNKGNEVHFKIFYRELDDFDKIQDSCTITLMRDK